MLPEKGLFLPQPPQDGLAVRCGERIRPKAHGVPHGQAKQPTFPIHLFHVIGQADSQLHPTKLRSGIVIFPPESAPGIPADARSAQDFPAGLGIARRHDAETSVLRRDPLVGNTLQWRQRIGGVRRPALFSSL